MSTYAQIDANAKDVAPFSNSTDGYAWIDKWCNRCAHDRKAEVARLSGVAASGCPILLVGLMGKTPAEWLPGDRMRLGDAYRCTEFRKARATPKAPPTEIPGQLDLFEEAP